MSKARTGLYDISKASGGMYLYEPPILSSKVVLSLFSVLVETLVKPKSASYKDRKEMYHNINNSFYFILNINSRL